MKTHEIKIEINFCDAVISGEKPFEIRFNDRGYQKGDIIVFLPYDTNYHCVDTRNPLYKKRYEITYVLSGYGLKEGYVGLGINPIEL